MKHSTRILLVIVISQFCCTSLWFAGNGVIKELIPHFKLPFNALGHLTSAVQFGFIIGTLTFAVLTIADRFSPSKVFLICAILGAFFNVCILSESNGFTSVLTFRFFTGFFLAGIYPIGMKIAADHFEKGLGKSLGFLVGALVFGTASPHLLKDLTSGFPWEYVLMFTSSFAVIGGILMYALVPDGPYRKPSLALDFTQCFNVFKNRNFRSAAFGYFGHMWELYAFWAFVPVMLHSYTSLHPGTSFNIPLLSFLIIGIGGLACFISGYLAEMMGTKKIAFSALLLSFCCCLISPFMFALDLEVVFIGFLLFWGMVVIADSPLFSTLVAQNASAETKGTALTIVNCIGFAITIISIQLINAMKDSLDSKYIYVILAVGPLLGLIALQNGLKIDKKK